MEFAATSPRFPTVLTHLQSRESESVYFKREVVPESGKPVTLDLAREAFLFLAAAGPATASRHDLRVQGSCIRCTKDTIRAAFNSDIQRFIR